MYAIVYKPSIIKILLSLIVICIYVTGVYYFISYYFIHNTIIFLLVAVISLLLLLRGIGIFLMYPGTFRYMNAQIQKNQNDNLLHNIHYSLSKIEEIANKICLQGLNNLKNGYFQYYATKIMDNVRNQVYALKKSQNPSVNKLQLIKKFQQLILQLKSPIFGQNNNLSSLISESSQRQYMLKTQLKQQQLNLNISLFMVFNDPQIILKITNSQDYKILQQKCQKVMYLCRKIWQLCCIIGTIPSHNLNEKQNKIQNQQKNGNSSQIQIQKPIKIDKYQAASWHLFQQKLFTIDSYFAYWDNLFQYTRFMVPVGNSNYIECAIIHSEKIQSKLTRQQIKQKINKNPCVLFSNPNGAIFQLLALNSNYINFYLKWGFQIVLWNYRGYAKSTGYSTISNAISDIDKVYSYVTKNYMLNIQVLHGYSIGGVCAINLANKLNEKSQKIIKLLVADRTFSSVDKVAKGLLKQTNLFTTILKMFSTPIVKLLFISQCMDNSKIFINSKCQKAIIYDVYDQIVAKQASLKYGILKNLLDLDIKKSKYQSQQQQSYFDKDQLKNKLNVFSQAFVQLYKNNKNICQKIVTILYDTDGAGCSLSLRFGMKKTKNKNQMTLQNVKSVCQQYFLGLFLFGPKLCVPYFDNQTRKNQWILNRIQYKINIVQKQKQQILLSSNPSQLIQKYINNILTALHFIKQEYKSQNLLKKRKLFGELIVTQVGHNRQLKKQYKYLDEIFGKIYTNPKLLFIKNLNAMVEQ